MVLAVLTGYLLAVAGAVLALAVALRRRPIPAPPVPPAPGPSLALAPDAATELRAILTAADRLAAHLDTAA